MPNPPDWKDCRFSGHVPQSTRFLTIDLRGVTGLTFFFSFSKVYAVHAHTPAMPYATRTFENLSKRRQAGVAWVYLPIPKGEDIIALGVRLRQQEGRLKSQQPCFLVIALRHVLPSPRLIILSFEQNWLVISLLAPVTRENIATLCLASFNQGCLYTTLSIWGRPPSLGRILRNQAMVLHSYHFVAAGSTAPPSSTRIFCPPRCRTSFEFESSKTRDWDSAGLSCSTMQTVRSVPWGIADWESTL